MATQAERRASTGQAILQAARTAFGRDGFDATSIDDVAAAAGVSKGAVYHHVQSKEDLFGLVLESVLVDLAARVRTASLRAEDPLDRIKAGCHEVLRACRQPAIRQIYLTDGPSVLGWAAWRDLDLHHFLGLVHRGLEDAVRHGVIAPLPLEPFAQLLGAAVTEAALMASRAKSKAEREEVSAALDRALDSLRAESSNQTTG
jgi:AcrR family transcriptional regulator